jgi:N-acetylmuramoyl-L-alanine amidase
VTTIARARQIHRRGAAFLVGLALACVVVSPCLAKSALVVYSDGRPSERIPIAERDGATYIGVSQAARLLGLEKTTDPKRNSIVLVRNGHAVEIVIGDVTWLADGQPVNPDRPAFVDGDEAYIDLASAEHILGQAFSRSLKWDSGRGQLGVGLPAPNILDIEVRSEAEIVFATIKTVGVLRYDLQPAADGKVVILARGGTFSKKLGLETPGGLIERIEAVQEAEGARITVTLGEGGPAYRVFPQFSPDGIVIKVWTRVLAEIPESQLKPPRKIAWQERFDQEQAKLDLVVVDPGHGGTNRGSVGGTGYLEKEFNLALARKVKSAIEARGIEVMMTRNDDRYVSLETRTELANSVGADLFLSIHANGFTNRGAAGFEVYFLSPAADEEARYMDAGENGNVAPASIVSDEGDEVAFILWDTAQTEFVAESSYLAQLIDEEISAATNIPNRGVKQANFFVLKGAYVPSILVETAFITNPEEEAMLKSEAFQDKIANAIVTAIGRYKEDYGR